MTATSTKRIGDFDGDGFVASMDVSIAHYPNNTRLTVRLTLNAGNVQSTLDLSPADLDELLRLLERTRKAAMKGLLP